MSGHSRNGVKVEAGNCINCGKRLHNKRSKYCNNSCQAEYQQTQWEHAWLSGEFELLFDDSKVYKHRKRIRTYLFKKYNCSCAKCGWGEVNPYTNTIPLEVDHIDGNYKNNSPDNLILLCPNCHALTENYKGANKGNGREWRRKSTSDAGVIQLAE